ncbi:MAG: aminoglycoside phosphotransferase family protein [Ruminococcaceae bacterium]|nr:aminoglycoside phosphotransferase family protein [Oscillospiraceae bacterium]
MTEYLQKILAQFLLKGKAVTGARYGNGHINETYLITTDYGRSYILQKINETVFKDVEGLMGNIEAVTEYLRTKEPEERAVLQLVKTVEGKSYLRHTDGTAWRVYVFVLDSICLQAPETPEDFYQSAVAFGRFQQLLQDFPAEKLTETIPNFHNTKDRYRQFYEVLGKDPLGRAKEVSAQIAFAKAHEEEAGILVDLLAAGKLPLRVTHNDTKLNNVMLDAETRKPLCVIDLDTVMPGSSLYDYGDSIRFGAATGAEDDAQVELDLTLFEIYTKGFLTACPDLTAAEVELLPMGAKIMTLECGLRFLTDYLDGDHYFANRRPGQNLDRCRTQFQMVADMEKKWDQMHAIVKKLTKERRIGSCSI